MATFSQAVVIDESGNQIFTGSGTTADLFTVNSGEYAKASLFQVSGGGQSTLETSTGSDVAIAVGGETVNTVLGPGTYRVAHTGTGFLNWVIFKNA